MGHTPPLGPLRSTKDKYKGVTCTVGHPLEVLYSFGYVFLPSGSSGFLIFSHSSCLFFLLSSSSASDTNFLLRSTPVPSAPSITTAQHKTQKLADSYIALFYSEQSKCFLCNIHTPMDALESNSRLVSCPRILVCRLEQSGIEPPTFRLDYLLYSHTEALNTILKCVVPSPHWTQTIYK